MHAIFPHSITIIHREWWLLCTYSPKHLETKAGGSLGNTPSYQPEKVKRGGGKGRDTPQCQGTGFQP